MTIKAASVELMKPRAISQSLRCFLPPAFAVMTTPAFGYSESGVAIDFAGGFMHPIFGSDHVVAMVAVGLWGAFLGASAIWLLPVVFPLVMALAGALGVLGMPLPGIKTGIAVSAIILGTMVALAATPPLWIAAVLVGAFAVFMAMLMAPSFQSVRMPSPFRWALLWLLEHCISPALRSGLWAVGLPVGSPRASANLLSTTRPFL
jgi:hydrogenase/urease accessory protein HupE